MSYVEIAKVVRRLVRKDGGNIDIIVKNTTQDNEYSASNQKLANTLPVRITSMQNGVKKLYEELK